MKKISPVPPTLLDQSLSDHATTFATQKAISGNENLYPVLFIKALHKIEKFVRLLETTDAPVVLSKKNTRSILPKYVSAIDKFYDDKVFDVAPLMRWRGQLRFSARVELFLEVVYGQLKGLMAMGADIGFRHPLAESNIDKINAVIQEIRTRAKSAQFRKVLARQAEGRKRQLMGMHHLVDTLFEQHARILIVRVDLGYGRTANAQNLAFTDESPAAEIELALKDRTYLINKIRFKPELFGHCLGYITKLEQSMQGECHFHTVFFFDGSQVQAGYFYAQEIGEYWKCSITKGRGRYHICRASNYPANRVGIGIINHYDTDKINVLKNYVLAYLAKEPQCLMVKPVSRVATITHSNYPKPKPKLGRKRRADCATVGAAPR